MKISIKKKLAAAAAAATIVGGAGIAVAYWTAGGSGTGTASTGSTDVITANQTGLLTPMYPGDEAQTLSGDFTNDNDGPVYVTSVTASLASVTQATGVVGDCTVADYTLDDAVMPVDAEVPVGTGGSWTGATIQFNNTTDNQDGCKGATLNIDYTIL